MSWPRALYLFFIDAFRPPFRTTPWIVLLYAYLSAVYNPDSAFNRWVLPDTDDYIRLVQVFNWTGGQGWFDTTLGRLYPLHPISMHWARLPDIPLAGVYLFLSALAKFFQWDATRQAIGMLTAFFVPSLLLTGLLFLVRALARPLTGKRLSGAVCFLVPLAAQLVFQFMPMRIDHHAWIILGGGAAFWCLQGMALGVRPLRCAAGAALALTLAAWNGAEILPFILFFCAALTLLAVWKQRLFMAALVFGAAWPAFTALCLLLARGPHFMVIEYDSFSFFYLLLALLAGGCFLALFLLSRLVANRAVLLAASVFTGMAGLALLLHVFPDLVLGPYAKANPLLNVVFFPNIREAVPLYKSWADIGMAFVTAPDQSIGGALYYIGTRMFINLAGAGAALCLALRKGSARRRMLWALYAFFGVAFGLLAMIWEVRVITYAQLFGLIPLAWLVAAALRELRRNFSGRELFAYEIVMVFGLTIFPMLVLPAILHQSRFMPDMIFFLGKGNMGACSNRIHLISYLRDIAEREKRIVTILAPLDYTPELMYYTPHRFIAAPYHRNGRGIMDMVSFFRSRPPDDYAGRRIAEKLGLDYVLICKSSFRQGTLDRSPEVRNIQVTFNNSRYETTPDADDVARGTLALRLANGQPPGWLEERNVPLESDFGLFEVKKKRLDPPKKRRAGKTGFISKK